MKRFALLVCFILPVLFSPFSAADQFSPTLLKLKCDPVISYAFDNSPIDIPIEVEGTSAGIIFCLFTRMGNPSAISGTNGYLGWHYVNKIDTCVYHSTLYSFDPGPHTITWDGRDQDGRYIHSGDYAYYLWGYDNVCGKQLMAGSLFSDRGFDMVTSIQEVDKNGLPLANPIWYRAGSRWIIGSDPSDVSLIMTTDIYGALENDWEVLGNPLIDPCDFDYQFAMVADRKKRLGSLQRIRFVPGGLAEVDATWGTNGFADTFETAGGGSAGVTTDGDYLFTTDDNHLSSRLPDADFYLYDYDGRMAANLDLTPWWSSSLADNAGALMNGGPSNFTTRNGYVFINSNASCLVQMVNPKRYLDTGEYDDFYVWSNGNGDYVFDRNFEETATLKWICNDDVAGPFTYSIGADDNLFTISTSLDSIDRVSFGLLAPDGTGLGYFSFTGDSFFLYNRGITFIDSGTPYDGIYSDYSYYFHGMDKTSSSKSDGIAFIAHDSVTGVLQGYKDCFGPSAVITLTTPAGGESLTAGRATEITWTVTSGCYQPDYLRIEYSTTGGETWKTAVEYVKTTDLTASWKIPVIESESCLVRLRNPLYGTVIDTSDAPFAIVRGNAVDEAKPAIFSLSQNVPNPFNPVTAISFTLPDERHATLTVYTAAGTKAATLADGVFPAGTHEVIWNASAFPSGVYLCRLRAGAFEKTVKMALVK